MKNTVFEVNLLDENGVITGSGSLDSYYDAVCEYNDMGAVAKELTVVHDGGAGEKLYAYGPRKQCGTVKIKVPPLSLEDFIRDAAQVQNKWNAMMTGRCITKKKMCDICVPFRDKYRLSDWQALSIARKELSLSIIVDLYDAEI